MLLPQHYYIIPSSACSLARLHASTTNVRTLYRASWWACFLPHTERKYFIRVEIMIWNRNSFMMDDDNDCDGGEDCDDASALENNLIGNGG